MQPDNKTDKRSAGHCAGVLGMFSSPVPRLPKAAVEVVVGA
jgi:hypothetical protein